MMVIVLPEGRVDEFVKLVTYEGESIALRLRGQYEEWANANLKADYRCGITSYVNRDGTLGAIVHALMFEDDRDAVLFKLWWM